ncbi:hypothetical protein BX600DRAFT_544949 [Xylariales sp. PMI_506]|nr:hypothetical protein BX600DRAFT_544949 [Xylariales sp. PMI_506]
MKAVVIHRFVKNYNELQLSELPTPRPNDNEILILVKAAGVNFVDTLYAKGLHQNNRKLVKPPFTLGIEFSGIVLSAPAWSEYSRGDRVFGAHNGAYATHLVIPAPALAPVTRGGGGPPGPAHPTSGLQRVPRSWTFAQAATIPATLPVSYGALTLPGASGHRLQPHETVLVHSAAGGLGLAAVQVARALGCTTVLGTAGSSRKCAAAESFGAAKCIDYVREPRWWEEVLRLTGGRGVDVVFDSVGLVGDSLRCLAHRGRVLVVGFAGRGDKEPGKEPLESVPMNRVLLKQATLVGYRFGESDRRDPSETAQIWKELWPLIEDGKIRPTMFDHEYKGLHSVATALEDINARKVWGKAIIQVDVDEEGGDSTDAKPRL